MSADFNKILSLLLVEEKSRNFPPLNAIHAEALNELSEIAKKLAEEQKKKYEEEQKKAAEEAAAEAARKKKESESPAAEEEEEEEHPGKVNRRL